MRKIKVELSSGDVPAVEVQHGAEEQYTLLKIHDPEDEILVVAKLNDTERYKLLMALSIP